jgi:hypothetical protein
VQGYIEWHLSTVFMRVVLNSDLAWGSTGGVGGGYLAAVGIAIVGR